MIATLVFFEVVGFVMFVIEWGLIKIFVLANINKNNKKRLCQKS